MRTLKVAAWSVVILLVITTRTSAEPLGTPINDRNTWPEGT